ncbi:MAG: hypothetical protein VX136_01880, partial [Pseudomonadota bacterium]|nr:hypothetical protein [Pseudomonadota bacterium]
RFIFQWLQGADRWHWAQCQHSGQHNDSQHVSSMFWVAIEQPSQFAKRLNGQIPLIGVGGITQGEHALAKKDAGASLVQIYSGLIYTGPSLIKDCVSAFN